MSKHTPGPWEIFTIASPAGSSYRIFTDKKDGSKDIAHIALAWDNTLNNARLIAGAPVTFDLLIEALEHLEGAGIYWDTNFEKRVSAHLAKL